MDYIDATNNPKLFVEASNMNWGKQKVFADLGEDTHIEWNGSHLIYVWPCHTFQNDYRDSHFPGLFKRSDPTLQEAFEFFDLILKYNNLI